MAEEHQQEQEPSLLVHFQRTVETDIALSLDVLRAVGISEDRHFCWNRGLKRGGSLEFASRLGMTLVSVMIAYEVKCNCDGKEALGTNRVSTHLINSS